jgi:predicted nucleic acid-binding Zn ribbon protein
VPSVVQTPWIISCFWQWNAQAGGMGFFWQDEQIMKHEIFQLDKDRPVYAYRCSNCGLWFEFSLVRPLTVCAADANECSLITCQPAYCPGCGAWMTRKRNDWGKLVGYLAELRLIESRLESDVAGCLEHAAEGGNFNGRALSDTFECHRLAVEKLAERMEDDMDEMKGEK